jgi:LemA protein
VTSGVIVLIVVIILVVVLAGWAISAYNGLVRLRNLVQESWRQIDVELHRRHDLIPNLVETVKGYAAHERETLEAVIAARNAAVAPGSSVQDQAAQENMLSATLGRLFAVAEAYPQLRANENFLALQRELTDTEDRIAAGRRFYNANVRGLNTKVESFPSNIVAGMFHFSRADYFEADDPVVRSAPTVSFGSTPPPPPAVSGGSTGAVGGGQGSVSYEPPATPGGAVGPRE